MAAYIVVFPLSLEHESSAIDAESQQLSSTPEVHICLLRSEESRTGMEEDGVSGFLYGRPHMQSLRLSTGASGYESGLAYNRASAPPRRRQPLHRTLDLSPSSQYCCLHMKLRSKGHMIPLTDARRDPSYDGGLSCSFKVRSAFHREAEVPSHSTYKSMSSLLDQSLIFS